VEEEIAKPKEDDEHPGRQSLAVRETE